jgi:predicted N-acetyltransferase YhbS
MEITLRAGMPADAEVCGRICFEAFGAIAAKHNFPSTFPTREMGVGLATRLLNNPGFYSVVAEAEGKILGSNFMDERSVVAGVGPITVDPTVQDKGVGHLLMNDAMRRCEERRTAGVRLLQVAYHNRSIALYTRLGFKVRDLAACLQGPPQVGEVPGRTVREARPSDLEGCNAVCYSVHGHDRARELSDAISQNTALIVEHDGRVTGYSAELAYYAHSVAQNNEDMKALILSGRQFGGAGILIPTSNFELFNWCLARGLRVVQLMTLMTVGLYNEPQGCYFPSVLY